MRAILQLAWDRFQIIGSIIGDVQGRLIATIFYFTILMPFGVISRLTGDLLAIKTTGTKPTWLDRPATPENLDSARRQG